MNKRGLSTIITILFIVILVIIALGVLWLFLGNFIKNQVQITKAQSEFFSERVEMSAVKFNGSEVNFLIKKLTGKLLIKRNESTEVPQSEIDIISIVDLSGSMTVCHNISSSCCDNLQDETNYDYSTRDCYGLSTDKELDCVSQCGGTWEDKITPTQNANKDLISNFFESNIQNKIGLVGYNKEVIDSSSIELTDDEADLYLIVNSWEANGGTCICCGINEAASQLRTQPEENTKAMIVMSDGEANQRCYQQGTGDSKQDAIKAACDANESLENFIIYSVGVGTDVDQNTLTQIAECGGGQYFSVANTSDLIDIYSDVGEQIQALYESFHKFNYFIIVFYNKTDSYQKKITELPNVLETKSYSVDLEGKLSGEIQGIEVYPVLAVSNKKEIIGPILDSWERQN